MVADFSESDQSIIKNMLLSKPYKVIASLLDRPLIEVEAVIRRIVSGSNMVTFQMKMDAKKKSIIRPRTTAPKKLKNNDKAKLERDKKHKEKMDALRERQQVENDRKAKCRPFNYKTKQVDYTQLRTVRIDRKTIIYAKPGEDIEKLKAKFLANYGKFKPVDEF